MWPGEPVIEASLTHVPQMHRLFSGNGNRDVHSAALNCLPLDSPNPRPRLSRARRCAAFQVLGHSKTVLVLLIAWLFFDSSWTARSLIGAVLALTGIVSYGLIRQREQAVAAGEKGNKGVTATGRLLAVQQQQPLLERSGSDTSISGAGTPGAVGPRSL